MDVTSVTNLQLLVLRDTSFSKNLIFTASDSIFYSHLPLKNPSAVGGPHTGCNKNYICISQREGENRKRGSGSALSAWSVHYNLAGEGYIESACCCVQARILGMGTKKLFSL